MIAKNARQPGASRDSVCVAPTSREGTQKMRKKPLAAALAIACAATFAGLPAAYAQAVPGAAAVAPAPRLSAAELETLVGPIALYPDDLVAIVLPSATTPLEIVKAQRFLDKRKSNASLQPDPSLPEPVRNLLNYPDVVKQMSDDLDWTEGLGQAVAAQQKDVMDAIQAFRRRVQAAGNLKTDQKQVVVVEKEVIKVVQADPQVIYVPQYQPSVVVVAQPAYAYTYYPTPYPVYYYPYPPGATFATGFFFGAATAYALGWNNHAIHHHYNARELQEERMDYARESREDWQSHQNQNREDRQSHQQDMQSQRSEDLSQRQSQRQGAAGDNQAQRQQAGSEARTQQQQAVATRQTQRQDAAAIQSSQPQRQPATGKAQTQQAAAGSGQRSSYPSGQNWQPAQTASAQRPAATRAGDRQYAADGGGAFGGMGSGADASRSSLRGSQSRFGGGPAAGGGFSGGARGGLGRR